MRVRSPVARSTRNRASRVPSATKAEPASTARAAGAAQIALVRSTVTVVGLGSALPAPSRTSSASVFAPGASGTCARQRAKLSSVVAATPFTLTEATSRSSPAVPVTVSVSASVIVAGGGKTMAPNGGVVSPGPGPGPGPGIPPGLGLSALPQPITASASPMHA
jgi:hypothetical protein